MHPLRKKKKKRNKLLVKLSRFQPKSCLWFALMAGCARCLQSRKTKPRPQEEVLVLFFDFFYILSLSRERLKETCQTCCGKETQHQLAGYSFPIHFGSETLQITRSMVCRHVKTPRFVVSRLRFADKLTSCWQQQQQQHSANQQRFILICHRCCFFF